MDINSHQIADGTTIPPLVKSHYGVVEYLICPGQTGVTTLVGPEHCGDWQGVGVDEDPLQIENIKAL